MKTSSAFFCLLGSLLLSASASAQDCNRDCLASHLNTYLDAVTQHTPANGNLWEGFRQTENSVVIPAGQGVWENVTALGSIQRRYFDPLQSQAGYFGSVIM